LRNPVVSTYVCAAYAAKYAQIFDFMRLAYGLTGARNHHDGEPPSRVCAALGGEYISDKHARIYYAARFAPRRM
jgi:hypothetical protein